MDKIGVFGGTFDPVHNGHEAAAVEFYRRFNLDRLLVIPANIPPHKKCGGRVSPRNRLEMCEICFEKYKNRRDGRGNYYNIEVSDIEIKKEGVSYTFDTLQILREKYGGAPIYFLVGSDMFLYLEHWHRYRELLGMCVFAVAFRNAGDAGEVEKMREKLVKLGGKIEILNNSVFEISSTEIRNEISPGNDFLYDAAGKYLDKGVLEYIVKNKIYKI